MADESSTLPETGFVRQARLLQIVPISSATLWRLVAAGTFPQPIKLSVNITAWRVEDLRRWIAEQTAPVQGPAVRRAQRAAADQSEPVVMPASAGRRKQTKATS